MLYELLTGHPDRAPRELVFLADLTVELRAWPADTWAKVGVDPRVAAGAVVAAWRGGDLTGLRLDGLTGEEALALERPAMTYVRAQLGDRLQRRLARPPGGGCTQAADACAAAASCSRRHLGRMRCPQAAVTKAYQLLGKVMAAAVDAGYLAQTPCRKVPLPRVEREEMRFLTPTEIVTLAEAIRPTYRALVFVGAYGGLRIGELAGLRRGRVDLLRGTVSVAEVITEVSGRLHFGPPKTRASRRTVGLPRFVMRELEGHLAGTTAPDDHVFTAPEGGTLRIVAFRNRIWRPATDAAGLAGLRIHDLRHTAVALWIAAGASPKEVAARAGHTSVSFTLDRYGHLYPEADTRLRERLDTLHASARPPEGAVVDLLAQDVRPQRGADM